MAKTEETKKEPKETKAKTNKNTASEKKSAVKKESAKKTSTTAAAAKKPAKTEKKAKQPKQTKPLTASDGWKEKKAQIKERGKQPKTLAERRAYEDKGPIRLFFMKHKGIWDFLLVPFFTFALLCLYSIASGNDRPAAVWSVEMSRHLFGAISFLFYVWVVVFCVRFWMRNIERFKVMHFGRYFYFLGLYFFVALVLQYNANKSIPVTPPEEAGGVIAGTVVTMVTNVLGNSGMLILLLFLMIFFIWQAWRFLAAREREKDNKEEVPVHVYWDVRTAAEAEALEAEKQKAEALTSDIEADFRSTMGLLTASEGKESEKTSIREEAGQSLRKLRDTFREIAQPIPDKEAMIPKEEPEERRAPVMEEPVWEGLQRKQKPVSQSASVKRSGKKPVAQRPQQLPLAPTAPELLPEEEELPPEPIFEEQEDHNGSGLLSAPAESVKPVKKEEPKPAVQVRTRSVTIDEEKEQVETTRVDYSFVPTIPPEEEKNSGQAAQPAEDPWILPDTQKILDPVKQYKGTSPDDPAIKAQAEKIERLLDTFGAPSSVVDIQCGPTFSQFGVEPGFIERGGRKTRVRIKQIEMLQKDLEMELSVKQLAIEAPIPGKTYVGIQVQNKTRTPVSLREVIEREDFRTHKRELGIALGKDINGATFGADLTRMPHLLIAGATGSGKSVCLNAILACLLLHNSPDQLKLVLVDPKRVELTGYNGIPHLITPVVTDIEQVGNVLQWVLREMDMRNLHFMENGVRNIQEYNRKFANKKLPYIVVVIDELANLMMEAASDIENSIVRLAQTARAMGIHLIVATQRPSRDVITGTIKGNLPTRIAFAVASYVDSQVILDRPGAENLFGKGDMYFLSTEETQLKRLQCVYVSDDEIRRIVSYWQKNPRKDGAPENADPDLVNVPGPVTEKVIREPELTNNGTLTQLPLFNEPAPQLKKDGDVLYDEAVKMVQRAGRASANMLVSRLSIGYSRANKLLARMEEEGIIGPPNANPAIPREILDYGEYGPENDSE
ncbi:MAG: hypothetical protein IJI57_11750 [Flexilinea sp.]|nr:hypothetical protein [Flexilinea sp.]